MDDDKELGELIRKRFASLPPVVQRAIISADITKHLQELAEKHKMHLDQWQTLENEVQLTLLGVKSSEDLAENIKSALNLDTQTATNLAADISVIVFEPIRQELERQLEHPDAVAKTTTGVEDMRTAELARSENKTAQVAPTVATPSVIPGTPPVPAPTGAVERGQISPAYVPATPSHERKTIEGDPYREQLK